MKAVLNGMIFTARYTDEAQTSVQLFNIINENHEEYYGKFEVDADGNLLEDCEIFKACKVIVGSLTQETESE